MKRDSGHPMPSLKKMLRNTSMITLVVLVFFILFYNFYSVWIFQQQIDESNRRTITIYANGIESLLKNTDAYMLNIMANSPEFKMMAEKDSDINVFSWSYTLLDNMKKQLLVNSDIKGFFLYSEANSQLLSAIRSDVDITQRSNLEGYMNSILHHMEELLSIRWTPIQVDQKYYLLHIMGFNKVYIGTLIDFDDITINMEELGSEDDYTVVYYADGMALSQINWIEQAGINMSDYTKGSKSGASGKYWTYTRDLAAADAGIAAFIERRNFLQGLSVFQLFIFYLSVLTILLIPFYYLKMRKAILRPLDSITATIRRVGEGHYEPIPSQKYRYEEFVQMGQTFNNMMEQIRHLKIESYERQLEKQHAQLQYLQLQIQPHFFLNCLKSIYAMAENGETQEVQEMILGLSEYFRYIFRDNQKTIPVKDELSHVRDYILLQKLNKSIQPVCNIDVDPRVLAYEIPPLSIQTFVENAVYHGAIPDILLKIHITLTLLEGEDGNFLDITVSDNGTGFPPEVLEDINKPRNQVYRDDHVGIHNVRLRIKNIYGSDAELFFYNSGKGAVSEIILPVKVE